MLFRSGPPRRYTATTERRILARLDTPPPSGRGRWNGRLLAEALGDVSADQVWAVLRKHGIQLQCRRSWCVSTDPEFARKAADIVGLYLDPPDKALVLCVDEKAQIQAAGGRSPRLRSWSISPTVPLDFGPSNCAAISSVRSNDRPRAARSP